MYLRRHNRRRRMTRAPPWAAKNYRPPARSGRRHMGRGIPHHIVAMNIGGPRQALQEAFVWNDSVLYRLLGPTIPGMQAFASKRGWHKVWGPATKGRGGGRPGSTAVHVRLPAQVHRNLDTYRGYSCAGVPDTHRPYTSLFGIRPSTPSMLSSEVTGIWSPRSLPCSGCMEEPWRTAMGLSQVPRRTFTGSSLPAGGASAP